MEKKYFAPALLPLLFFAGRLPAQTIALPEPNILPVPIILTQNTKLKLTVLRGTKIRFEGRVPETVGLLNLSIKAGGSPLVSGRFDEKWRLEWDSAAGHFNGRHLFLCGARQNAHEVVIADIEVDLLEKPPFTFAAQPDKQVPGRYVLSVKPTGSAVAERFEVYCDGNPLKFSMPASGTGTMDTARLLPGIHKLSLKACLAGDSLFDMGTIDIHIPTRVHIESDASENICDLRQGRTRLRLTVLPDRDLIPTVVEYFLDGKSIEKASDETEYDLSLAKLSTGKHRYHAIVTADDGRNYASEETIFEVRRDLAGDYNLWKANFNGWVTKQQESLEMIRRRVNERYLGLEQCNTTREDFLAEMKRFESAPFDIANLDWPLALEGEDRRSLTLAKEQLGKSFRMTHDAMRDFCAALADILRYDGTVTNLPREKLIQYRESVRSANSMIAGASDMVYHAADNVALVDHRGNVP